MQFRRPSKQWLLLPFLVLLTCVPDTLSAPGLLAFFQVRTKLWLYCLRAFAQASLSSWWLVSSYATLQISDQRNFSRDLFLSFDPSPIRLDYITPPPILFSPLTTCFCSSIHFLFLHNNSLVWSFIMVFLPTSFACHKSSYEHMYTYSGFTSFYSRNNIIL